MNWMSDILLTVFEILSVILCCALVYVSYLAIIKTKAYNTLLKTHILLDKEKHDLINELEESRKECKLRAWPIKVETYSAPIVSMKNELIVPFEVIEQLGKEEAFKLIEEEVFDRFKEQIKPFIVTATEYDIYIHQYVTRSELKVVDRRQNKNEMSI